MVFVDFDLSAAAMLSDVKGKTTAEGGHATTKYLARFVPQVVLDLAEICSKNEKGREQSYDDWLQLACILRSAEKDGFGCQEGVRVRRFASPAYASAIRCPRDQVAAAVWARRCSDFMGTRPVHSLGWSDC